MSYADKLIPIQPSQSTSSYKSKLIPIQSERGKRITQGLPVSSDRRFERTGEATPNFGGEIARSIIKPIARLGQNITGKMDDSGKIDSRQSNYLGTIKPVGNSGDFGKDVLDSIGVGAEIGSNLIGGTGAGAVAKTGLKGLVKQGVTTGARAGIGAGATYGLGAGLQDQKDKNVGQILGNTAIQTVKGGAIGGLAGGVLGGAVAPIVKPSILLPKSSATKAVSKTENELLKIENNYQKLRKNAKFSKDGNAATRKRIAQTGVMTDATDDTGTIITDKIIPKYRALSPINNTEGVVRKNLERLGETVDLDTVENKLLKSVYDSGLQGANLESAVNTVKKEIAGYRLRANPDGRVPLTLMHDAKIDVYNSIDFNTSAEIKAYKKILAKGLKEVVEENSSFNVKEVNETLAPYLKDIEYLESLNGRKVKGGKLGKYSARIAGNIAGGIAGGSVGGLPGSAVGTIVGGEVGDVIQGKILKNTFGRTAETALPESKILKKAVQTGNSPRLQLPAGNKDAPRIRIESGRTINLPKRTQSTADAQSLANLKAQKIAPPSNIPSKVSISKTIPEKKTKPKLSLKDNRGFIATGYKETGNLTTKILKDLEGKTTVSKQYILDATNRGELKQVERDLVRQVLDDMDIGKSNLYNKIGISKKIEKPDIFSSYKPFKADPEYAKFYAELKKKYGDYALVNLTDAENTTLKKLSEKNIPAKGTPAPKPVEQFRGTKDDIITGDELFHATTPDRIDKIASEGLKINTGAREAMSNRGDINPLFFSDSPRHALGFINDLKNENLIKDSTEGVLLRVRGLPKENLTWDSLGKNNSVASGGSWSFDKNIPAKYIEIKENGVWKPLSDFSPEGAKSISSDTINVKEFADRVKSELLPLKEDPLLGEALKYKNGKDFYELSGAKVNQALREKGIRGQEQVTKYWEEITGKKSVNSYAMSHRPQEMGAGYNIDEIGNAPNFYENPEYFKHSKDGTYDESIRALLKIKGKPEAEVTVYRASPKAELNKGDWISLSKKYAQGESLSEGTKVHSFKVKAKDIQFAGDDINEFGYFPK